MRMGCFLKYSDIWWLDIRGVPLLRCRAVIWSLARFLFGECNEVGRLRVSGAADCRLGAGAVDAVSRSAGIHIKPEKTKGSN